MLEKLEEVEKRYEELGKILSDPEIIRDRKKFEAYAKEHAELTELVQTYQKYKKVVAEIEDNKQLLKDEDEEIRKLAHEEIKELSEEKEKLEKKLKTLLIPDDPNNRKNIFLEIRAGTGGEEAALFARDLFRMYTKYAESKGWKVEIASSTLSNTGGFKEVIALIKGRGAYSRLKYERGVHRVQRVPVTESQGRIHTSAVTVAVLPEAEELEVEINPKDLRIDVFRSSGPGGQSVNTTDSAVRVTHIPTGIVVSCQDEKSQHKNKARAMSILRARLKDRFERERHEEISRERRSQVGTGDRSERIRTYNFPQGRVTDHRIGLTLYKLDSIMEGELDGLIDALIAHFESEALKNSKSLGNRA